MNDRLQETTNGQTTIFTMDLNPSTSLRAGMGLTQALSDGTNTYIYGNDRITQLNTDTEYFLGDALGSARQIANNYGTVTLAQSYDPYGNTRQTSGDAQTNYGFTGEYLDPSGMIYLRARYYDSLTGRFMTRDTWEGDANAPASLNRFNYAHSNPVMYTDPTGNCVFAGADTIACALIAAGIGFVAGAATGAAIGGAFGLMTYQWALAGECGCEMQKAAVNAGSMWAFAGSMALSGGIIGGIAGGIAALAPIGMIIVSGLGLIASTVDLVKTVNIIRNEVGSITPCTAMRLMMDVAGIVFSGVGIAKGVQAWRASGSGFRWTKPNAEPVVEEGVYCSFSSDEEVTTTPEHPFYTEEDGWVAAGDLTAGMHVRKADGSFGEIDATRTEESTQRMYNLTVDDAHTFFVGDGQWLVHNYCAKGLSGKVVNDPEGEALVGEAINYARQLPSNDKVTIAVARVNGQKVVSINGNAPPDAVTALKGITDAEGIELTYEYTTTKNGAYHAEQVLYQRYAPRKIGISNRKGPCFDGGCNTFFKGLQLKGLIDNIFYPAVKW